MKTMPKVYQTFQAEPDYCSAFLGLMVDIENSDEPKEAYCEECEERHIFKPIDD